MSLRFEAFVEQLEHARKFQPLSKQITHVPSRTMSKPSVKPPKFHGRSKSDVPEISCRSSLEKSSILVDNFEILVENEIATSSTSNSSTNKYATLSPSYNRLFKGSFTDSDTLEACNDIKPNLVKSASTPLLKQNPRILTTPKRTLTFQKSPEFILPDLINICSVTATKSRSQDCATSLVLHSSKTAIFSPAATPSTKTHVNVHLSPKSPNIISSDQKPLTPNELGFNIYGYDFPVCKRRSISVSPIVITNPPLQPAKLPNYISNARPRTTSTPDAYITLSSSQKSPLLSLRPNTGVKMVEHNPEFTPYGTCFELVNTVLPS